MPEVKHVIVCPAHPFYKGSNLAGVCTGCNAIAPDSMFKRQTEMIEGRLKTLDQEARDWKGDASHWAIEANKSLPLSQAAQEVLYVLRNTSLRRLPILKRLIANLEEAERVSLDRSKGAT